MAANNRLVITSQYDEQEQEQEQEQERSSHCTASEIDCGRRLSPPEGGHLAVHNGEAHVAAH